MTAPETAPEFNFSVEGTDTAPTLPIETALPFEDALEQASDLPLMDSIIEPQKKDSSPVSGKGLTTEQKIAQGLGLYQTEFCNYFKTTAPTVNGWLKKEEFKQNTTAPDGSYWKKENGLYYKVSPTD